MHTHWNTQKLEFLFFLAAVCFVFLFCLLFLLILVSSIKVKCLYSCQIECCLLLHNFFESQQQFLLIRLDFNGFSHGGGGGGGGWGGCSAGFDLFRRCGLLVQTHLCRHQMLQDKCGWRHNLARLAFLNREFKILNHSKKNSKWTACRRSTTDRQTATACALSWAELLTRWTATREWSACCRVWSFLPRIQIGIRILDVVSARLLLLSLSDTILPLSQWVYRSAGAGGVLSAGVWMNLNLVWLRTALFVFKSSSRSG